MARIAGVDIPNDKRVVISLTYVYGIGKPLAQEILKATKISEDKRAKDLTRAKNSIENSMLIGKLANCTSRNPDINEMFIVEGNSAGGTAKQVEGDLRRDVALNIKRLSEIGSYRGLRHRRGLPVRGQSTKTNARTRKGPRKTIANKKKATQ